MKISFVHVPFSLPKRGYVDHDSIAPALPKLPLSLATRYRTLKISEGGLYYEPSHVIPSYQHLSLQILPRSRTYLRCRESIPLRTPIWVIKAFKLSASYLLCAASTICKGFSASSVHQTSGKSHFLFPIALCSHHMPSLLFLLP